MNRRAQSGMTLVVSLIMLIVLTLLVVSAIRFGNINLKITGNAQTKAESTAAAQVAIEQTVQAAVTGGNLSAMSAASSTVSTGGTSYTVSLSKPTCNLTQNVATSSLDPSNTADRACFGQSDTDKLISSDGSLTSAPSACKDQLWDISAGVNDGSSGASVTVAQGVSLRVSAEVSCP
jgi:Tfp pilus assembly protein PilX